jgi:uncharacterized protein YjbI with pentapeptide repeats
VLIILDRFGNKLKEVDAPDLCGANLRGAHLRGANLYGADLRGADLRGADLYGADLRGAHLCGANLRGANLRGAHLYGADLHGAHLYGADLRGANLHGATYGDATCLLGLVQVLGLAWPVYIFDKHIKIGCQLHTAEEWANFTKEEIDNMADGSAAFWKTNKEAILAMAKAHQGE